AKFLSVAVSTAIGLFVVVSAIALTEWGLKSLARDYNLSPKTVIVVLAILGACLGLLVLLSPVYYYVRVTQRARRRLISSYYRPDTIAEYLQQFWSSGDNVRELLLRCKPGEALEPSVEAGLTDAFNRILDEHFGYKRFFFPTILLSLIGFLVLYFVIEGSLSVARSPKGSIDASLFMIGITLDGVTLAAVFGAYTWVTTTPMLPR